MAKRKSTTSKDATKDATGDTYLMRVTLDEIKLLDDYRFASPEVRDLNAGLLAASRNGCEEFRADQARSLAASSPSNIVAFPKQTVGSK